MGEKKTYRVLKLTLRATLGNPRDILTNPFIHKTNKKENKQKYYGSY